MAYYIEDQLTTSVLGPRRPTINEYFLSSYTLSIYDGCEFGCPYCDGWAYRVRPFNETVRIAVNLPEILAAELETVDRGDLIGITALTDPYQPAEATHRLTRQVLQILADRGQPCLILTKKPSRAGRSGAVAAHSAAKPGRGHVHAADDRYQYG